MSKKGIYWFTTDLRLDDNPALKMAAEAMDQLLFVYSVDIPVRLSHLQVGSSISQNRQTFLSESLHCLNEQLQDLGQHLVVIENTQSEMAQLIDDHGITHIYRNSDQHVLDSAEWLKIQTHYPQINFSTESGYFNSSMKSYGAMSGLFENIFTNDESLVCIPAPATPGWLITALTRF